ELVALNDALERLAQIDARQSRVVELRFFGGLTVDETAEALGMSSKTVKRDWSVARAWLHREGSMRAAFLDEVCSGDPSLRAELGELIASHERAGSFMGAAAFEPAMRLGSEDRLDALVG